MKTILNRNYIVLAVVIVGLATAAAIFYLNQNQTEEKFLSLQEAGEKAIAFINQTIIEENITASLVDVVEENMVYRVHLKINETGAEYDSYITKDGKFLFPSGFEITEQPLIQEEIEETVPANLADFAKCLTAKGMRFYGSKYCPWCQKQKEIFGDSLQYIVYVECIDETDDWSQECRDAQIDAVPTWQLPDGEMDSGYKTFDKLSELSGCLLK